MVLSRRPRARTDLAEAQRARGARPGEGLVVKPNHRDAGGGNRALFAMVEIVMDGWDLVKTLEIHSL